MGVHHYKLGLIPRKCFPGSVPSKLSESEIDQSESVEVGWWSLHPPSQRLLGMLKTLLPIDKSWGDVQEYVSSADWGSDLRIWRKTENVWAIHFRFSPIADSWTLMRQFLDIAMAEDCLLYEIDSGAVILPQETVIRERLASSRAMSFVRDPISTIVDAAKRLDRNSDRS